MTEEATVPAQRTVSADEQALLRRLRSGEDKAFSELFELHAGAVRRLARGIASDSSEAEDITAETFFRVLQALRRGAGPKDHVRAYLLTVARRVSWEWHGARRDVPVTDDELTVRVGAGTDAHARTAEHTLIATAFTSLPERWRSVLWQTEVEGEQPAVVAPHFGLSANATAALARRARQGLRAAYLQAHLAMNRTSDVGCRGVVEKLGGYTAGSVTGSEASRIRNHLMGCASCRSMHAELRDVCSSLRAHAGVLALLVPAVATAAGAASTVSSSGALATLKSLLLSKLKIGIAVASTAAAGAFGIAVPAMIGSHTQAMDLPQGGIELQIALPQSPPPDLPPLSPVASDQTTLRLPGRMGTRAEQQNRQGSARGSESGTAASRSSGSRTVSSSTAGISSSGSASSQATTTTSVGQRDDTSTPGTPTKSSGKPTTTLSDPSPTPPSGRPDRPRDDLGPDPDGNAWNHTPDKGALDWWSGPPQDHGRDHDRHDGHDRPEYGRK
ncbi:sigma-70 family RNA polymerase sigma factor [Amycolatopsis rhizosphaerae]|uniref:Sigma-70 family RNA polymerase sigma factor n=1 Tax=Amycolatopsis rhizosphaerae TaxID=2053003 RepID=A0A558DPH0_9PSEU|nr:sigma-70 family RNA polymerase sigma factor [Amycolatopsis rhizosphaerae]TVT62931.1 sigma-70 family RNA polymerase sigma factor [Amycolatopsis rhizosphaerae]